MPETLKLILAVILGLAVGYLAGHHYGKKDGTVITQAAQAVTATNANTQANKQRENVDHEARTLPDAEIDGALSAGGWLRD